MQKHPLFRGDSNYHHAIAILPFRGGIEGGVKKPRIERGFIINVERLSRLFSW
jgi:hypothetical protein